MNRLDFAFAVGKIRAKEITLLTQKDFLAILEMDLGAALKYIVEKADYPQSLLTIKNSFSLEEVLDLKLKELLSLTRDLLKEKDLIEILSNLKAPKEAIALAERLNLGFFVHYYKSLADLLNIKLFFRFKNLDKKTEDLEKILFDCGYIKKNLFLEIYLLPWEKFLDTLRSTRYGTLIDEAFKYFKENNSFLKLEVLIKDYLINLLKPAKYICLGPEPPLVYYLARENEIDLLRRIILAKLNQLPKERILLNSTYAE